MNLFFLMKCILVRIFLAIFGYPKYRLNKVGLNINSKFLLCMCVQGNKMKYKMHSIQCIKYTDHRSTTQ